MSFEHFERGYLLPVGCKDLMDVIELQAQPKTTNPEKPLFMAVCHKCEAKCFVRVPNSDSGKPSEPNETVHPAKFKVPFVCPRCGHKQVAEH
jgi:transcription elongation factor Elf1